MDIKNIDEATNVSMENQPEVNFSNETYAWYRYFARSLDLSFATLVAGFALFPVLFIFPNMNEAAATVLYIILAVMLSIVLEAGMLALFGTTLSKLAFGIQVLNKDEKRLTFKQGIRRCVSVWIRGLAFGIPVAILAAQWRAHERLIDKGITSWDEIGGLTVKHKRINKLRAALFIILDIALTISLYIL